MSATFRAAVSLLAFAGFYVPDRDHAIPEDSRRARVLIPAFATAAARTADKAYVFGYRERLDWDELAHRACAEDDQRAADVTYQEAARMAGIPRATLGTVVALSQADKVRPLVRAVIATSARSDQPFEELAANALAVLVRAALVQAGVARWRLSWSDPFDLVTSSGEVFDATPIATLLLDAATASDAAAHLTALGVDPDRVGPSSTGAERVGQIVGGIAGMKAGESVLDVLVLDNGLLLAEKPRDGQGSWHTLSDLINSGSTAHLAALHRFVPYTSMTSAKSPTGSPSRRPSR